MSGAWEQRRTKTRVAEQVEVQRDWGPGAQRRESGRQIVRQWMLLRALSHSRRGMTVNELCEALEDPCATRTVYRDLDQLEAVGFALARENGRIRLLDRNTNAPELLATAADVLALRFAEELTAPIGPAWIAASLATLRKKLNASLTPKARAFCEQALHAALVSLPGSTSSSQNPEIVNKLDHAIQCEHRVRLRHASPGRPIKDRIVEPRALWYTGGALYLVAQLVESGEPRKFAVTRIETVEVLDEPFEPDASFSPRAYVQSSFGVWHGPPVHAVIDFARTIAHLFEERRFHPSQRVTPLPGGCVRVELDVSGTKDLARWLAGFGGEARVVGPEELVEEVRRLHAAALR